jgi:hypothetical protein
VTYVRALQRAAFVNPDALIDLAVKSLKSVSEGNLPDIPPQFEFIAVSSRVAVTRNLVLPPGSSGFIPVTMTQQPSSQVYEIGGKPVTPAISDGTSFTLCVKHSELREIETLRIFPIPAHLHESQFSSPLANIHLMLVTVPLLFSRSEILQSLRPEAKGLILKLSAGTASNTFYDTFIRLGIPIDCVTRLN